MLWCLSHYYNIITQQLMIFHSMQEGESVEEAILAVPTAQPCIIVQGQLVTELKEAILVIEKKFVTTFDPKEAPLLLLGAFYAFNMHYRVH